jgi:hypothetical protein
MPALERRVQLLLDPQQYKAVEREAARSGQSVAAVIRDAIDARLAARDSSRAAAARRLLAATDAPDGPGEDWERSKAALDDALAAKVP